MDEGLDNLLDYLQKAGLNTINTDSPAWKLLGKPLEGHLHLRKNNQRSVNEKSKAKIIDKTIEQENGQKMTVGQLVRHRTVPQLGLGLVVGESKTHKNYWIVKWCDPRYYDVGQLGIDQDYLVIV